MSDETVVGVPGGAQSTARAIDIRSILDEGEWGGYQKFVVFLAALTIIFDGADNQLLAVAIPTLMQEWGVTRAAFAPIVALGLGGMMIGGAIAGIVGDRLGRRVALIGSVATFGAMTAAASLAEGPATLGVMRFLAGLGLGGAMPNAAALASEFVPRRSRPFAVTLTIVCVPLGATLTGLLAIRILPELGWRGLFAVGGIIPLVLALALIAVLPESPRFLARHPTAWPKLAQLMSRIGHPAPANASFADTEERGAARPSIGELFVSGFRRDTFALWIAFFCCLLSVYMGFNWVPSMLTGAGLSPTVGSTGILAFNLGGVVGAITGALIITQIGSRPTMISMAAGAALAALVMRGMTIDANSDPTMIIAMLAITGGLINAVQTTLYALAAHVYPTSIRATGVGGAVSFGRIGGLLSSYAGAIALDLGGSAAFFTVIALMMVVVLIGLAMVHRHIHPVGHAEA